MSEKELVIIPYKIQEHAEQVQGFMDKYMVPKNLERMGLRINEVTEKHYLLKTCWTLEEHLMKNLKGGRLWR